MFGAVILAGASKTGVLENQEGVRNKAFILIEGRPMIAYVFQALQKSSRVDRIVIVGPFEELQNLKKEADFTDIDIVSERGSMLENVEAGLQRVPPGQLCFIVTSDIPLLSGEAIQDFIFRSAPLNKDFYYPILDRRDCEKRFPEMQRTYVRLKEGSFTGGNLVLVNPSWFLRRLEDLAMFIAFRKKPWKLVRILSPILIWKYFTRSLTAYDLELYFRRRLGGQARAIRTPFVEIGTDVDKLSDLELVRQLLKAKQG